MGIVAKQSILNTIFNYLGFAFGALNTLFLFTHIFSKTNYGLVTYLMTTGNLLWPFLAFGMQNTLFKFYHSYTSPEKKNYFFSWILLLPIFTTLIVIGIYILFYDRIHLYYEDANAVVSPYVWVIIVLGLFSAYFELFFNWAKIHLKSVGGNFIKALFLRVTISILLLLAYLEYLSVDQFIYALTLCYIIRTILMAIIAYQTKPFKFQLKAIDKVKEIITYSALILIASVVALYLLDLDKVMIEAYLPIDKLPSYAIAVYIATVIAVPARALLQITTPLTAKFISEKDYTSLNELNKKSSINGLIIAGIVAILVITNAHSIFELVPKDYDLFIEIVIYIALVRVFDASLGVTNSILINSEAYRWVLFFGVGILALAFGLNIFFIPKYGIIGAALATFISYTVFNLIKLLFVKQYFKIQPYQFKSIGVLLLLILVGLGFYYIEFKSLSLILNILIKGCVSLSILVFSIYKLKFSSDINNTIDSFLKK